MQLKTGMRLRSVVGAAEVIVVRATSEPVDLRCGGHSLVPAGEPAAEAAIVAGFDGETLLGKRYVHDELGFELLCTKSGPGALSLGDEPLPMQGAKQLPTSD